MSETECTHPGCGELAVEDGVCLGHHRHVLTNGGARVRGNEWRNTGARQQAPVYVSEQEAAAKPRCKALNKKGEPCRSTSLGGDGLCSAHGRRTPLGTAEGALQGAKAS